MAYGELPTTEGADRATRPSPLDDPRLGFQVPAKLLLPVAAQILEAVTGHIDDLDDLCRVDTGGLDMQLRPVELDDVLAAALDDLGPSGRRLVVDLPETAPDAIADADGLSRALTADALRRGTRRPRRG